MLMFECRIKRYQRKQGPICRIVIRLVVTRKLTDCRNVVC